MKHTGILTACTAAIALTACEKELDFRYTPIAPLTVIEAELTPSGAKVAVSLTTPMDEPMDRTLLTDATVTLLDLTDGTECTLTPDTDGLYTSATPGITGHDYTLTVERRGQQYTANATMYPPTEITDMEFSWIRMPYDHVAVLQCQYRDLAADGIRCYWVKIYRNGKIYCWAEQDNRIAHNGICTYTTTTTRKDTDKEDDDEILYDGDEITCTVCPVSQAMHNYLEALQNNSNGPALFAGDRCLGYFIATSPVSASVIFRPDDLPLQE